MMNKIAYWLGVVGPTIAIFAGILTLLGGEVVEGLLWVILSALWRIEHVIEYKQYSVNPYKLEVEDAG